MGRYCVFQLKRLGRQLLAVVLAMGLLALCLALGAGGMQGRHTAEPFPIGLVGIPEGGTLRLGLTALESLDDIGLALELVELTAHQAPEALARGDVKAYVVIPEGFVSEASHGNILTIEYVTTREPEGITALFQQELTAVIGHILMEGEKASFGTYYALAPEKGHKGANAVIHDFSLDLAELLFVRNRATTTVTLGVGNAPSLGVYLACGLSVAALVLAASGFAPVLVQRPLSLSRMLCARGRSPWGLALVDLGTLLTGLAGVSLAAFLGAKLLAPALPWELLWQTVPAVVVLAAFSYLSFSIASQLHSALLLYFFAGLGLCLVCGCFYPAWFFPEAVQRFAAWLPPALARRQLTGALTGNHSAPALWGCLGEGCVLAALGIWLRARRIRHGQEAAL